MKLTSTYKFIILLTVFLITLITLFLVKPIAQDPNYHNFADNRFFFSVPNFMDVFSNTPFVFIGLLGFSVSIKKQKKISFSYFLIGNTLFLGIFLTGIGSAYYHLFPSNFSLIFDRLPMTIVFSALFSMVVFNYVSEKVGIIVFYGMLLTGLISMWHWYNTELLGAGDLRLYVFVQFFPILTIPIILLLYKTNGEFNKLLIFAFIFYSLAKLGEYFDAKVYVMLKFLSGHTIKHLLAALATYFIYKLWKVAQERKIFLLKETN